MEACRCLTEACICITEACRCLTEACRCLTEAYLCSRQCRRTPGGCISTSLRDWLIADISVASVGSDSPTGQASDGTWRCTMVSIPITVRPASKNSLHGHLVQHTGIKAFTCHVCGKGFSYSSTMKDHVKQFHSDAAP